MQALCMVQVVLACRSEAEAGSKLASLKTERANVQASFLHLDLARLTNCYHYWLKYQV